MSKKTIYKHFKSKEDLLSAVISSRMNFFQKELEPILNNTEGDFISWLIDLGTAISKQMCEIPLVFLNDIEKNAPLVWKELVDRREQVIREGFKKFIDYGIKAGDFRKDLPVEIIVDFYYFLNSKVFVPNYVMNCGYTPPQLYNFIIKLFLEGLFTPFGREEYNAKSKQNNDINNLNFFLRTSE
jgi:AcrR family transcriptional regulator